MIACAPNTSLSSWVILAPFLVPVQSKGTLKIDLYVKERKVQLTVVILLACSVSFAYYPKEQVKII